MHAPAHDGCTHVAVGIWGLWGAEEGEGKARAAGQRRVSILAIVQQRDPIVMLTHGREAVPTDFKLGGVPGRVRVHGPGHRPKLRLVDRAVRGHINRMLGPQHAAAFPPRDRGRKAKEGTASVELDGLAHRRAAAVPHTHRKHKRRTQRAPRHHLVQRRRCG
jgi:hypothetical protein